MSDNNIFWYIKSEIDIKTFDFFQIDFDNNDFTTVIYDNLFPVIIVTPVVYMQVLIIPSDY